MKSGTASGRSQIERLEQRRLLCGNPSDPAAGHAADRAGASETLDVSAGLSGRHAARGHVVAAFARSNGGMRGGRLVWGETTVVDGALVATWAIVSKKNGSVMAAGASMPNVLAENMPARGTGPAGAFASLEFPAVVRDTTYFDHLEIQPQPVGHASPLGSVNPNRNAVPHFDFHFYAVAEADVFAVPSLRPPPGLPPVAAERLPAGHIQPGPSEAQMGRHSAPQWSLADPGPLSTIVLAGYMPDASQMHFIEPMISREVLLEQRDFTLNVPMPQTFDRDTLYPTRSEVVFQGGAHHFIYSDFIDTGPATPSGFAALPHVAEAEGDEAEDETSHPTAPRPESPFGDSDDDDDEPGLAEELVG